MTSSFARFMENRLSLVLIAASLLTLLKVIITTKVKLLLSLYSREMSIFSVRTRMLSMSFYSRLFVKFLINLPEYFIGEL